jgi:PAS domain S-box-containing protein
MVVTAGTDNWEKLLGASPDALIVAGADGIVESATGALGPLFGYRPDDVVGRPIDMLIPARLRSDHAHHVQAFSAAPESRPMGVGLDLRAVRADGAEFPVDVSLVPLEIDGRLKIGAFVRDATDRRRHEDLLRSVNEISRIALEGWDVDGVLGLAARRARRLVGATVAWVAVRSGDVIVVAAADGARSDQLIGATLPVTTSLSARVMHEGVPLEIADMQSESLVLPEARGLGLGPGIYLPMLAEDGPVGALVLARNPEAGRFRPAERSAGEVFASAAAIVLALGTARRALEESRITVEHERIARDLHDTVIQRLFALGMKLQATERLAPEPVAERIRDSVDSIDDVIRDIRETIFDLNRPGPDGRRLRDEIRRVVAEASGHLGFTPRVAFRGPVETLIGDHTGAQVLSVLREALANVGRHARAGRVDIVIGADRGWATLSVADDGIGIPDVPAAGHGLANMRARAEGLGGNVTVSRRQPSGTVVDWRVPLPDD